ncbi:hypothetical protein [Flavihumibacter solisilvae]|nr:hypothetical protein [Flavihumibacter solisilvae]
MINKYIACMIFCVALIIGCSKDKTTQDESIKSEQGVESKAAGAAIQISGIGSYGTPTECNAPEGVGATFTIRMTGDLVGCVYTFVTDYQCSPSGTYREQGTELFVGTYNGQSGTFMTGYRFEGKYEGCPDNGEPLGLEIFGRCQHPVIEGSGTGVFSGVTGRLSFKDNVVELIFPYEGHLKF